MVATRIKLEICGSEYILSSTDSEEYTLKLGERLDREINEILTAAPAASITSAAVLCALSYLDELEKSRASVDNMRVQIKDYLDDAAKARLEVENLKKELASLSASVK